MSLAPVATTNGPPSPSDAIRVADKWWGGGCLVTYGVMEGIC
jgi:hypothetical protein